MSGVDPNRAGVIVVGGGASLPTASGAGEIPVSSGAGTTYAATGAAGVRSAIVATTATSGLLSALPVSASEGDSYFCTDTLDIFFWRSGAWRFGNGLAYEALPATPVLHLRADLGVTSSSGVVSAWASQGSVSTGAAQGSSGYRPTIVSGLSPSGKPGIVFDGVDDSLDVPYNASWAPSTMTLVLVADVMGSGTQVIAGVPYEAAANTSPFGVWYVSSGSNTSLGLRVGASTSSSMTVTRPGGDTIFSGPRVYVYTLQGGAGGRVFRCGGRQIGTDTGATPNNVNSSPLRIGANGANAEGADMRFYELQLYTSVLTTAQIKQIERRASAQWGVPLQW